MEERSAPLEVPVLNDSDVKGSDEVDSSAILVGRQDANDVSMPICFLVKEQAKSLIAIQDLQNRVESIENVQDNVIESLAEIRKFLCNDSKTFSSITLEDSSLNASNQTPSISISKSGSFSKGKSLYSPLGLKSKSPKECDTSKLSPSVQIPEHSEKPFELKNKELALESDKQDSGLDSDCREIHDNLSFKPSINWVKAESNDELLLLLDEISQKTEVLQKQLAVIDQKSCFDDSHSDYPILPPKKLENFKSLGIQNNLSASVGCMNCSKNIPTSATGAFVEENMERKNSSDESPNNFDSKSFCERVQKIQKRTAANKIDSAMVSSILKETSVVDLQRQVLIYLVENAVLHTKLGELEQLLSYKTTESNKIESSLKDETRLLMMENRELRISLDEQKLETNSLRSKVVMLERVLQSVTVENRELTWQLGESLGIQTASRREPRKVSNFSHNNPTNSKFTRRSSLSSQFVNQNDGNVNCVKSKLLSNASNFLDVTVEEPEQRWTEVQTPAAVHENPGPLQSSTPMTPFTKLRDVKMNVNSPSSSPSNFQSVKKRFKSTEKDSVSFKSRNFEKRMDEVPQDTHSEACIKNVKLSASNYEDSAAAFPFNTILEKLKANSDYRLSRRTSLSQTNEVNFSGDHIKSTLNKGRPTTSEEEGSVASSENLRPNSQTKNFQARKGKNIHQRIQDILDRIMSEEAT